jgi:hypothetical protein
MRFNDELGLTLHFGCHKTLQPLPGGQLRVAVSCSCNNARKEEIAGEGGAGHEDIFSKTQ